MRTPTLRRPTRRATSTTPIAPNASTRAAARTAIALLLGVAAAPAPAAPETYAVDGTHTYPRFSWNHLGLSTQLATFGKTTGTVVFDAEAQTGSVDIEIDMTSVNTGFALFDEHIQDTDFFDTANHPKATFKSTRVDFADGRPVAVHGDLTIKGITKPVTLTVTRFVSTLHPMRNKPVVGADATAVILRSDFNAGKYAPNVSDEVTLSIALEAVQP